MRAEERIAELEALVDQQREQVDSDRPDRGNPVDPSNASGVFFAGKGGDGARCIDLSHILGHDRSNVVGDGGRRNCQRDGLAPTLLRRQWLLYPEPKNI